MINTIINGVAKAVGIISFLVLLLEGVYYLQEIIKPFYENKIRKVMSWREFDKLIDKLAKQVTTNNHSKYSLIVGMGRGGGFCAAYLSCKLESIPIIVLDRDYQIINNSKTAVFHENKIIFDETVLKKINEKKVLIVSQQSHPGISIPELEKVLVNSGIKNIETCAVLKSDKTADNLNYWALEYTQGKKCKKFPWENDKNYVDIMKI